MPLGVQAYWPGSAGGVGVGVRFGSNPLAGSGAPEGVPQLYPNPYPQPLVGLQPSEVISGSPGLSSAVNSLYPLQILLSSTATYLYGSLLWGSQGTSFIY